MEFHNLKKLNVVFGGCARDCEKYILKLWKTLIYIHHSSIIPIIKIVIEDGSKDNTKNLLNKYKTKNDFCFYQRGLI